MKYLGTILCALLLAGCARFQPEPLSPGGTAAAFDARTLADPGLGAFARAHSATNSSEWPPASWNLESLTLVALYYSPDLAIARARAASAEAAKTTAAGRPNPVLSVSPAYDSTVKIPSPWLVTASLDVPIETAGKRGYRRAHAAHLSEAARLSVAGTAWEIRLRLRRALVELWAAEENQRLLGEQLAAEKKVLDLLQAEVAAGALSRVDIAAAQTSYNKAHLALNDAETRRLAARAQLATALGLPAQALAEARFSFDLFTRPAPEAPPGNARSVALLNRADILASLAEYAAAESDLQLQIARQYPDIHLSPGYEFDQGENKWGLGLGLELPLLNQNQGPIAEAEARRREQATAFQALQARVIGEIDAALAIYQSARNSLAAAADLREQARRQEADQRALATAGEVDAKTLAAAELESAAAALAALEAQVKVQQALATLEGTLQTAPTFPDTRTGPAGSTSKSP